MANPNKLSQFLQELKRRKVIPFLVGYVAACIAIISFLLDSSEIFSVPKATIKLLYLFSACGLPVVILLPWYFNRNREKESTEESSGSESDTRADIPFIQNNSIIVLPFENISNDPEQEYFSDGLTEEITADLSQIRDLKVISRNSAMTLKGINKRMNEIASELKVRYVLEGSVRKAEKNLRITAQLIDAVQDTHIWAEKYDGTLIDVFKIQERVSRSIVKALEIRLSPKEELRLADRPIENIQAYEFWLKARYEIFQYQQINLNRAIVFLRDGLKIVGENAILYAGLGLVYVQFYNSGLRTNELTLKEAENYARKSLELDSKNYLGYYVLGLLQYMQGKIEDSVLFLNNALELNPNHSDSLRILAYIYIYLRGKIKDGKEYLDKLLNLDPYFPLNHLIPMYLELAQGNLEVAMKISEGYIRLNPDYFPAQNSHLVFLLMHKRTKESLLILKKIVKDNPNNPTVPIYQCLYHCVRNQRDLFFELFSNELEDSVRKHSLYSLYAANCFALINEKEKSLDWLENSVDRGMVNYPFLNNYDPFLQNIRGEDRFIKLMDRVRSIWKDFTA